MADPFGVSGELAMGAILSEHHFQPLGRLHGPDGPGEELLRAVSAMTRRRRRFAFETSRRKNTVWTLMHANTTCNSWRSVFELVHGFNYATQVLFVWAHLSARPGGARISTPLRLEFSVDLRTCPHRTASLERPTGGLSCRTQARVCRTKTRPGCIVLARDRKHLRACQCMRAIAVSCKLSTGAVPPRTEARFGFAGHLRG